MSYILDGVTLPDPVGFRRRQQEISRSQITLNGKTKKDIAGYKEIYILQFRAITMNEANTMLTKRNLKDPDGLAFQVTEPNLSISSTKCHVSVSDLQYNIKGGSYLVDLTLELEEVSI